MSERGASDNRSDRVDADDGRCLEELTAFQRDLLTALCKLGSCSGAEVRTYLQEVLDQEVSTARLYTNFDKLSDRGLVSVGTIDQRTNSYRATSEGKRRLVQHIEWVRNHLSNNGDDE